MSLENKLEAKQLSGISDPDKQLRFNKPIIGINDKVSPQRYTGEQIVSQKRSAANPFTNKRSIESSVERAESGRTSSNPGGMLRGSGGANYL